MIIDKMNEEENIIEEKEELEEYIDKCRDTSLYIGCALFFGIGIVMLMGFLNTSYEYDSTFLKDSIKSFNNIGPSLHKGFVERPYIYSIRHPVVGLLTFLISLIGFIYFGLYEFIYLRIIKPLYLNLKQHKLKREIQSEGGKI